MKCFKTHKADSNCTGSKASSSTPKTDTEKPSTTPITLTTSNSRFEILLQDPQIKYFLGHESLKIHLKAIFEIMNNPRLSGEQSSDGRRSVALKKLRELRAGGLEENELVEEFVCRVLDLLDEGKD